MRRLDEKAAVVTGAAGGIGEATALLFAEHGARVVVADINEAGGDGVVSRIRADGGEARFVKTDVSSAAETDTILQAIGRRFTRWSPRAMTEGVIAEMLGR